MRAGVDDDDDSGGDIVAAVPAELREPRLGPPDQDSHPKLTAYLPVPLKMIANSLAAAASAGQCRRCAAIRCPSAPSAAAAAGRRLISDASQRRAPTGFRLSMDSLPAHLTACFLLLLLLLLPVHLVAGDSQSDGPSELAATNKLAGSGPEDKLVAAGEQAARQYFKLRVIPSPTRSARKKKAASRDHKQKITNATLRKLLNQSLLKAANGSSPSTTGGSSNFRLVFVQRSPVLPVPPTSSTTTRRPSGGLLAAAIAESAASGAGLQEPSPARSAGQPQEEARKPASSLSKQIAETLLSSTLNMALQSPAISSFASKLAVKGIETMLGGGGGGGNSSAIGQPPKVSPQAGKRGAPEQHAPLSTSINTKTRQPSKVYNLPIKFVADGQPYHLTVLSALKKHLLASGSPSSSSSAAAGKKSHHKQAAVASLKVPQKHTGEMKQHRKSAAGSQSQPVKKQQGNSRLIYLPLKYFSNGRVSKVVLSSSSGSASSSSSSSSKKKEPAS